MRKLRIAVLAGGWSGERDISLESGKAVFEALNRDKYEVLWFDPSDELEELFGARRELDLVFNVLHGSYGEDGCIQGFLGVLGIPVVGSGVLSSAMSLNKTVAKGLYKSAGLKVARDVVVKQGGEVSPQDLLMRLGGRVVVKPVAQGSSLGASVCESEDELAKGLDKAFEYGGEALVEEYLKGREVTCCVLGNEDPEILPLIEIVPGEGSEFFDFGAKYVSKGTQEICPAMIPESIGDEVRFYGKKAHEVLKCKVWSRTDVIIGGKNDIYVLETNTLPGMTPGSLFPLAASAAGMSLPDLVDRMVELTLESKDPC